MRSLCIYNFFAVFFEPSLIALKNVSSNFELFVYMIAILALVMAIFLFTRLSHLYKKYSHDKFGENMVRTTNRQKSFWNTVELLTSIPAIACYVLFMIVTLILAI